MNTEKKENLNDKDIQIILGTLLRAGGGGSWITHVAGVGLARFRPWTLVTC